MQVVLPASAAKWTVINPENDWRIIFVNDDSIRKDEKQQIRFWGMEVYLRDQKDKLNGKNLSYWDSVAKYYIADCSTGNMLSEEKRLYYRGKMIKSWVYEPPHLEFFVDTEVSYICANQFHKKGPTIEFNNPGLMVKNVREAFEEDDNEYHRARRPSPF